MEQGKREALIKLNAEIKKCRMCLLSKTRNLAVCGEGNPDAEVLFVGEAPGAQEDISGLPFVGAAGKWLGELLTGIGLSRDKVYITNLIKCRPPENRNPLPAEVTACSSFIKLQLKIIKPKIICTLGSFAWQALAGESRNISAAHGRHYYKGDMVIFASYHPAAALYAQKLKEVMREDFTRLQALL